MAIWREERKNWKRNKGIEQGDRYKYKYDDDDDDSAGGGGDGTLEYSLTFC